MFERYTDKARRVIFFARYEASNYGSPYIETEHLLLGVFREHRGILTLLPDGASEAIRKQIDSRTLVRQKIPKSVDLPLSNESKRVLHYGAEEADRLAHRWIAPEHLLLGLLREKECFAAALLGERGMTLEKLREDYTKTLYPEIRTPPRMIKGQPVNIHGLAFNSDLIRERVRVLRQTNWHWEKRPWKALDIVIGEDRRLSFDISLAEDPRKFELRRGGWTTDKCAICEWELYESTEGAGRGTGYTNGRNWVCTDCYDEFLQGPDYFGTAYPEIT